MEQSHFRGCLRLVLLPAAIFVSAFVHDGLVPNGDFETEPERGFRNDDRTEIPNWTIGGAVEVVSADENQGGIILVVPQGKHAVRLGNEAEISQDLAVKTGGVYAVTFSAARTCAQQEEINISAVGVPHTIDLQTIYNVRGWDAYAWAFRAEDDRIKLTYHNTGTTDDPACGPIIDDVSVKKMFPPKKSKDNVVVNGDFEEGPWMFMNVSLGVLLPTSSDHDDATVSALPGWIVESSRAVRYIDSDHFSIPQGKRAVELLSGKEGVLSQMIETKTNKSYTLQFSLGEAGDRCRMPMAVMAFAGDQARNVHYSPNSSFSFRTVDLNFTAAAEKTRIAFYSVYYNTREDDRTSLCGPVVDDVRVSVSGRDRKAVLGTFFAFIGLLRLGTLTVSFLSP